MIRALAGACHPGPTVAVTVVAVLLGVGVGLPAAGVALLGAAVLTGQLSIGWSNDALDARRDRASDRRDKPAARGAIGVRTLVVAATVAVAATIGLSLALGWRAGLAQLVLVAAGWAYNLGLKGTVLSAAAYAVGFGALPAAPWLALPGHPAPPWWAPVTGALLGVAAHVANVLPDLADDAATGVRGLPHRLGVTRSRLLMAAVLVAAALVAVFGSGGLPPAVAAVGLVLVLGGAAGALVVAARRPDSPRAFYAVVAVALVDVVLFVLAT